MSRAEAVRTVSFIAPPPGLEPLDAFALEPVAGAEGLYTLTAAECPEIRLFTIDAERHLPGYSPELPDERAADLGITVAEQALLLVVVTPSPEGSTVNLLAPVIVNRETGSALQLVLLEDDVFPVRAELATLVEGLSQAEDAGHLSPPSTPPSPSTVRSSSSQSPPAAQTTAATPPPSRPSGRRAPSTRSRPAAAPVTARTPPQGSSC